MVLPVTDDDTGIRVLYDPAKPESTELQAQIIDIVTIHGIPEYCDTDICHSGLETTLFAKGLPLFDQGLN
ncbi:hypothetical protein V8E51_017602 [Hyaloscypha variabilis]